MTEIEFAPDLPVVPALRLRPLSDVQPRQIRWLVPGMIPLRTLTLVAGVGGLGKSTWTTAIAANLSTGTYGEPADSILVSLEDPAEEVIRPRAEAAGADLDRIHDIVIAGGFDSVQIPTDIEAIAELVADVRAKLVVFDPIVAAIETTYDAHKDQHVRRVLAGLKLIAETRNCAIVMVAHLNKNPSTDAYLRINGSVAFWNASRSVVLITEDPDDPDTLRLLTQRKANWARLQPVERHRVESILLEGTVDSDTGKPIETSRMVFVEHAHDVDGADVLGTPTPSKTSDARTFLLGALADGEWHDSAGLKVLAPCSPRTLQRAANDLEVETDRRGFPASTWWRISESNEDLAQLVAQQSRHALTAQFGATGENGSTMRNGGATVDPVATVAPSTLTGIETTTVGATGETFERVPLDLLEQTYDAELDQPIEVTTGHHLDDPGPDERPPIDELYDDELAAMLEETA